MGTLLIMCAIMTGIGLPIHLPLSNSSPYHWCHTVSPGAGIAVRITGIS